MGNLTTPPPRFDVAKIFGIVVGSGRTTVRLHPRKPNGSLDCKSSKVGGTFLWRREELWPFCTEHKSDYAPILQLRAQEFSELRCPPGADTLQLLWCPNDHPEFQSWPAVKVFWHNSEHPDLRGFSPGHVKTSQDEYLPKECELNPERVQEFPSAFALNDDDFERMKVISEEAADLYQYSLSVAPGIKVGGFPNWSQDPEIPPCECGRLMDYVLTIDSSEFDGGTFERWLPIQERDLWDAPYEKRTQVQSAAGLMLGDMGEMNLFACMHCSPWRYKAIFQCS